MITKSGEAEGNDKSGKASAGLKRKVDDKEVEMETGMKADDVESNDESRDKRTIEKLEKEAQDVESEAKSEGLKREISCELPGGEQWAAQFVEEEESDLEDMDEEEAEARRQLKWETWKLTIANLWDSVNSFAHVAVGSHEGAFSGGSSHNAGSGESGFSMEQFNLMVQGAKMQAAQVLVQAKEIEDAYKAAGMSDDPDLLKMSAEVDKVGALGVELHHVWKAKMEERRAFESDKTRQVESFIKASGKGKTLEEVNP